MRRGLSNATPSLMTLCPSHWSNNASNTGIYKIQNIGNVSWQQPLCQSPLSFQSHMTITRKRKAQCFMLDWKLCDVHIGQLTKPFNNYLAANPFPYIQMIRGQTQVFYKKKTLYNIHRHNLHHNQSPLPSLLQWSESPQVRRNYGVIPAIILPFCYKNDEWSPATQRSVFSRYLLSTLILNIRIRNTTH